MQAINRDFLGSLLAQLLVKAAQVQDKWAACVDIGMGLTKEAQNCGGVVAPVWRLEERKGKQAQMLGAKWNSLFGCFLGHGRFLPCNIVYFIQEERVFLITLIITYLVICRAEYVIFLRKKNIFMFMAFQVVPVVKNPPANTGDPSDMNSIPGSGRFPGLGNDNQLQYSCLENSMDRGAWWTTIHRVAKSQTRLSD